MQTYTVQTGDTLFGISRQFGISMEEIKKTNNLSSNTLIPGQILTIPGTSTTMTYTVKAGDNLYDIASRYNTTVQELMQINQLANDALSIGQQLIIPINETNTPPNYTIYTVKAGDNLYNIANNYNTSVNAIMQLNNLSSTTLSIDQQLKIPIPLAQTPTEQYQDYIVAPKDSLYKIANQFGMSLEELIQINNLNSNSLSVGQILQVKKHENIPQETITYEECFGEGYVEPSYETYTVKSKDSLYTIAQAFNTSVENLIALNQLENDNLSIGQILKIKEVTS